MDILPGMDFARSYHILEEVGRGHLGTVYKAFEAENARYVALRVLPAAFSVRAGVKEQFEALATAWAGVHHPHVQEVYAFGQEEDLLFLAGEFVDGGSLAAHLGTPISMSFTLRALTPIANALDFAHAQGVLHRDVKPANIMLSREGRPVLVDFGLVQLLESAAKQSVVQTSAGAFAGTPAYMAPEHATRGQTDAAADRYALGVVAYEMLTGQVPFTGDTPLAVLLAQASNPVPPANTINPALGPAVAGVLHTALAKDPAQRYPTAGVFMAELEEAGRSTVAAGEAAPAIAAASGGPGAAQPPAQNGGTGTKRPPARPRPEPAARAKADGALPEQIDAVRTRLALSLSKGLVRARSLAPLPVWIGGLVALLLVVGIVARALAGSGSSHQALVSTPSPTAPVATATAGGAPVTPTAGAQPTAGATVTAVSTRHPGPGTWASAPSMHTARSEQQAVVLKDGKVLVIGGQTDNGPSSDVELYDPASGKWTKTGSMSAPRQYFSATLLQNGKVLVAGGQDGESDLTAAELYDPQTGTWSATGDMAVARDQHTATLLDNGKVLVAGGEGSDAGRLSSAELYDPAAGKWTTIAPMLNAHWAHTATLLKSGKVLVAGGGTTTAELFDPTTGKWSATGAMLALRYRHTATLLDDGRVLVVGGEVAFNEIVPSAEIYDPRTGQWSSAGTTLTPHGRHTATLLHDGRVLILGGESGTDAQVSSESGIQAAEIFDPSTGTWSSVGKMATPRAEHTASLLPDGRVLVAGGFTRQGSVTDAAELYTP